MANKKISGGEVVWLLFIGLWFGYAILCGLGVTKTFWGWDAQQAGIIWNILMFIPLAVVGCMIYLWATASTWYIFGKELSCDKLPGMAALALLALAFTVSTGFKFTAGDIGQRISAFKADGSLQPSSPDDNKITGKEILFEYYSDFYHLDTDTALVNYINTYNELPGINYHNHYRILWMRGDTINGVRPSKAPRADEYDFQWHSHRDNKIAIEGE